MKGTGRTAMALAAAALTTGALAADLVTRDRFVADPSAHVFGGRVYVYATDDSGNDGTYWNSRDWRLYSSTDLRHWRDHGEVFSVDGFRWAESLAWAPNALQRGGKTFFFLPVDRTKIGVAVGSSPVGPFKDAIGGPLIDAARDANTGPEPIDPHVFVTRDGRAFLYFGARHPKVVALTRDLTHLAGPIRDVEIRNAKLPYGEAPWLHEHKGLYYFSYSTGWPGQIVYATGTSPDGPFTQRGVLLDRRNTYTNHQAIITWQGRPHLFYHEIALPGGSEQRRSIAHIALSYRPDGTIAEAKPRPEAGAPPPRTKR